MTWLCGIRSMSHGGCVGVMRLAGWTVVQVNSRSGSLSCDRAGVLVYGRSA